MRRAARLTVSTLRSIFLVQVEERRETFPAMNESKTMTFSTRAAMLMVTFMLAFLPSPRFCADKIDANIDIALVIADDNNYNQTYQIQACKKLMSYFETGEEKVRFALSTLLRWNKGWPESLMHHAQKFILMNFTGDPKVHSKVLENVTMPWRHDPGKVQTWSWSLTIHHVSEYVITNSPPGRLKAVVIFLSFFTNTFHNQFSEEPTKLRDKGAWVYVLTKVGTKQYVDDYLVLPYANNLTGNPNRTIIVGHTNKNFDASLVDAMPKIRDGILRDTCLNYGDTACAYKDKERLKCEYATQYVNDPKLCVPFGLNIPSCYPADCRRECDRRWPWVKEPCVGKCGVEVEGERKGASPPVMMENCPLSMTCPPCTTTSSKVVLIVSIVVPVLLILIIAVVAVIVMKQRAAAKKQRLDVGKKTASFKGPVLLRKASKKITAGKEALVGGGMRRATDTSVAADMSVVSRMPSRVNGTSKIKGASKMMRAAKSVKSEVKGPSAKQGARGKSPVKK